MDYPRYSTGYTTLFNTFLAWWWKPTCWNPISKGVEGTYELMKTFISLAEMDASLIKQLRSNQEHLYEVGTTYPVSWKLDSTKIPSCSSKDMKEPWNLALSQVLSDWNTTGSPFWKTCYLLRLFHSFGNNHHPIPIHRAKRLLEYRGTT